MTRHLVLKGGAVIDGTGAPAVRADVTVEGNTITAIAANLDAKPDATVLDCSGQYVIPGLWDGHVHLMQDGAWTREFIGDFDTPMVIGHLEAALRSGVTSVVDVTGTPDELANLKARQRRGELPDTASLYFAGPGITAPGGHPAGTMMAGRDDVAAVLTRQVADPRAARDAVVEIVERFDADVIKAFYTSLWGQRELTDPRVLEAIVDAAARHDRHVVAHVDWGPEAAEAIRCGVRGLEHIPREGSRGLAFALAAERGTIWTPTLAVFDAFAHASKTSWLDDQRQRGAPDHMLAALAAPGSRWLDEPDPRVEAMMAARVDGVRRAYEAGVTIAVGTDAGANGTFHGIAVHRELELLVQAGLTPLEAISGATLNVARKIGVEDVVGSIAAGMTADLVVLDRDPLADIRNTRSFAAIVHGGFIV